MSDIANDPDVWESCRLRYWGPYLQIPQYYINTRSEAAELDLNPALEPPS